MIRKLRIKFIAASMLSLTFVLLVILGGVNIMSYRKVVGDAEQILAVLGANGGDFPKLPMLEGRRDEPLLEETPPENVGYPHIGDMSPETPYESRFFSVLIDEQGHIMQTDTGQIAAVDSQTAAEYALEVWSSGRTGGFFENYRYTRCTEEDGERIIFLDCTQSLSGFYSTLLYSAGLALAGLTAVFVLLALLSRRIIRPLTESYEKQKQFITNAGHELKTPLTIISADTELIEIECGESQWLDDIRNQVQRLSGLTNDLIYLSRMEEEQPRLQFIEFPVSDVVEEMAQSFAAPAKSQGKIFRTDIRPMLSCTGDEKSVRQLVSILLDNALKYSPEGGEVTISLEKQGRSLVLTVFNTTAKPIEKENLEHLFDRFYRIDQSRSTQTGGYGLGLSMAKSIVQSHKGRIRADSHDGHSLTITAILTSG